MRPATEITRCPYSASCFECPCSDCRINCTKVLTANRLETDLRPELLVARNEKFEGSLCYDRKRPAHTRAAR